MEEERDEVLKTVAANLRTLRRRRGLTQAQLAEIAEVDSRKVQRAERAEVDVGIIALAALAAALRVRAGLLFRRATFEKPKKGRPKTSRATKKA